MNERMDERTDERTDRGKLICPPTLCRGGIKTKSQQNKIEKC